MTDSFPTTAADRYLHGAYHPNGQCPNGMCAQPTASAAHKPLDYDEEQGALVCQMHGVEDCWQNAECHDARNFREALLVPWGGRTLCKCPYCGGLDVSYLGYDGLDICGTCHHPFRCRQEPLT